jgi:hypothetical protein
MASSGTTRARIAGVRRELTLGSHHLDVRVRNTGPAGPAHYVDNDRRTVCGGELVSFTFPGRALTSEKDICSDCVAATATQRRAG